jgi:hypothetical protein
MDWYTELKKIGFTDTFQNELSARKTIPDSNMEVCWYRRTNKVMLQTKGGANTKQLPDIHSIKDLRDFWKAKTGKEL